jgi:hypothetical protein
LASYWLRQGSLADLSVRPIALITTIPGICRTELSSNPVSVVPETSGYRHRRQRTERSPEGSGSITTDLVQGARPTFPRNETLRPPGHDPPSAGATMCEHRAAR